ncbi:MAG: sugar phosphate isomerase/epimerase, partial [Verrucomicrobiota bacterium]
MNRRRFLQASTAALSASVLQPLFAQTAPPPSTPFLKKAVNLAMIKEPADASIADKFKMARDAGFQGIELNLPDEKLDVP